MRKTIKDSNLIIDIKKVVWFDEKHIAQEVGGFGNKRNRLRFKRDIDGNIDLVNGKYAEETEQDKKLHFKYTNEYRATLGVVWGGKCLKPFNYSSMKLVITAGLADALTLKEIARVKGLQKSSHWVVSGVFDHRLTENPFKYKYGDNSRGTVLQTIRLLEDSG